jgi:hypothetical protein
MTETPETKPPATPSYDGWHLSDETRHEDRLYNERAEARDRYEREHYGWALFAVITLLLAGGFQIINGLVALFRSGTYKVGSNGLAVQVDYTTWGWIHLALGAFAFVAALGLMGGNAWARILAVCLSVVSSIAYMAFAAAFPALSVVVIAMNILVMYAVIAHGGDLKNAG